MCLPLTYVVQRIEFIVFYMSLHWPFRCAAYHHHNPLWALSLSLGSSLDVFPTLGSLLVWLRCLIMLVTVGFVMKLTRQPSCTHSLTLSLSACLFACLSVRVSISLSLSLSLFNYAFQRIDLYYNAAVNYQTFTNGCPQFRYAVQCITCNVVQCS